MSDRIETEEELRYWLAEEDWYMSRHTQRWLDRTPRAIAADMLARIAEDAGLEPPHSVGSAFLLILNLFSVSGELGAKESRKRKAGIRAALMLANIGDSRAAAPLARVSTTIRGRQSKYQELIEAALTRIEGVRQKPLNSSAFDKGAGLC